MKVIKIKASALMNYCKNLKPIVHGKWQRIGFEFSGDYKCSECNTAYHVMNIDAYRFCPYCGADMREVENEVDS